MYIYTFIVICPIVLFAMSGLHSAIQIAQFWLAIGMSGQSLGAAMSLLKLTG